MRQRLPEACWALCGGSHTPDARRWLRLSYTSFELVCVRQNKRFAPDLPTPSCESHRLTTGTRLCAAPAGVYQCAPLEIAC